MSFFGTKKWWGKIRQVLTDDHRDAQEKLEKCYNKSMETIKVESLENSANLDSEEKQRDFRRTFGQKVVEVFEVNPTSEDANTEKQKEYIKTIQEERALLETLDSEQRYFQDYIFYMAIEKNPEASHFIKNIPGLDMSKPLVAQLLEKDEDGSQKVSDETVGNILEFYQSVLKKEEGIFAEKMEKMQSDYESGLKSKVESGKLPQALYENYERAKTKNNGSIIGSAKLFDLRPVVEDEEERFEPPSAAAYIEHRGMNNKGEMIDSGDTRKTMYKKFFLDARQKNALGSLENMVGHELTHIIAGTEASFNLLPSEKGSADIPSWRMDIKGKITMAFREGMTEAIGQMIMDSSPEADSYSLRHYLNGETGSYPGDREFLAKLIDIDDRYRSESQNLDEQETLEKLFLEAYAETDGDEYVNKLRNRLYLIFDNWEDVVRDEDFPDTLPIRNMGRSWENAFSIYLDELELKYAHEGR